MDLAPAYDAPYTLRLTSAAYQKAASDFTAAKSALELVRATSTDNSAKEAALQRFIDAKSAMDGLGELAYVVLEIPRLDWEQVKAMSAKLKGINEKSVLSRAEQYSLSQWERYRALREIDAPGISIQSVVRHATVPEGAEDICNQQIPKAKQVMPDGSRIPLTTEDAAKVARIIGAVGRANLAVELISAADVKPPSPSISTPNPL
jgi:hypothetical protein